jgi:hypothetical protein
VDFCIAAYSSELPIAKLIASASADFESYGAIGSQARAVGQQSTEAKKGGFV